MTTRTDNRSAKPTAGRYVRPKVGLPACVAALILAAAGCNSINTVLLQRNAANTGWERECDLQGIPITLKVPTHIKLYVYDKHYLERSTVGGDTSGVRPVALDVPLRDFASEFMYTDKIFTVDFKRPAGGAINLRLKMADQQQYFETIQQDITDQTIKDVGGLLSQLFIGDLPTTASGGGGQTTRPLLSEIRSLVAVGVFEIADPQFMTKVQAFLNCHINKAHDAWVAPPGVTSVERVGVAPTDNLQVPYPNMPFCPDGNCGPPPGMLVTPAVPEGNYPAGPPTTMSPHGETLPAQGTQGAFTPWGRPQPTAAPAVLR